MTTFIYVRVSTKEQHIDGASLPVQIRLCLSYCRHNSLDLHPSATNIDSPGVFADPGVSAWRVPLFQRPGFSQLWGHVQPGDSIVFLSFDRAFRSTLDFFKTWEVMKQKSVVPMFVRDDIRLDTAAGTMWATVVASFAQYQSDILSERIREAFAIRRAAGIKKGEQRVPARREEFTATEDIRRICTIRGHKEVGKAKGRVFGYCRVSTGEQDSQPQAIAVQQEIDHRLEQGYTDGGMFVDDGVSAYYKNFRDRPAGKQIWDQLQPGDLIIVTRLDRIFRSTVDMGTTLKEFDRMGVSFTDRHSRINTSTLGGRTMANFLCVMAQWESESISWRVKLGMEQLFQNRGPWHLGNTPRWIKQVPFGVDEKGEKKYRLEVIPEVVRDMTEIRALLDSGMTRNEVSDVMQQKHEAEQDFPRPVPRCGLGSRATVEMKYRRRDQFEEAAKVRRYCEKFGIGQKDEIDRWYSLNDQFRALVDATGETGMLTRYLEANGSGTIFA